jgi:hypothetical protein
MISHLDTLYRIAVLSLVFLASVVSPVLLHSQPKRIETSSAFGFYREDVGIYLGCGANFSSDYRSNFKQSLLNRGYTDVSTGWFGTVDAGLEFRVIHKLYIGPKVRCNFSILAIKTLYSTSYSTSSTDDIQTNIMYSVGPALKFYFVSFDRSAFYLTGSYSYFNTSYSDDTFAFKPDGQETYVGLGYEFDLSSVYMGIEIGYSHIPVVVQNNVYLYPYGYLATSPVNMDFGGVEIGITVTLGLGLY